MKKRSVERFVDLFSLVIKEVVTLLLLFVLNLEIGVNKSVVKDFFPP